MSIKVSSAFILLLFISLSDLNTDMASAKTTKVTTKNTDKEDTSNLDQGLVEPIEHIFSNPAVAAGLSSGARAVDKSIDTLFDSLFYSIMDNKLQYDLNEYSWLGVGFQRDLYTTNTGSYIVADRFRLGPAYQRELWRIDQTPINVGIDTGLEILQLYLRSDGQRLVDDRALPTFRRWANNWFGLLPLLEYILPPSFNPNEMYDPWRQLYTPFTLPLSVSAFYKMPQGSISSYAIDGGVTLSSDLFSSIQEKTTELTDGVAQTNARFPFAVYIKGDYRINIFRRGKHTAWIGISSSRGIGQTLSFDYGSVYYILKGALAASYKDLSWVWGGVPIKILPVNIEVQGEFSKVFDQVYEFDLRNKAAQEAYEKAVVGDFSKAYQSYITHKEKNLKTGVVFHFTKEQVRFLKKETLRNSFGFANNGRHLKQSKSKIKITDNQGKFYILEMIQDTQHRFDDVLVGEEGRVLTANVELNVVKILKDGKHSSSKAKQDQNEDQGDYRFAVVKDPMHLGFFFAIRDNYLRSDEYSNYLKDLNYLTLIDLGSLPEFPRRNPADIQEWRKTNYFTLGEDEALVPHVPYLHLGKFSAQALVAISYKQIKEILSKSEQRYWSVFSEVYNKEPTLWSRAQYRATMKFQGQWVPAFMTYPLRYVNLDVAEWQAIHEIDSAISAIMRLKDQKDPEKVLDGFYDLFDTDYPLKLYRALLLLAEPMHISRRVSFAASSGRRLEKHFATKFKSLDGKIVVAGPGFAKQTRYEKATQTLSEFELSTPIVTRMNQVITSLSVKLVGSSRPKIRKRVVKKDLQVKVTTKDFKKPTVKVYFRLEEDSSFRAAQKRLAEGVIDVRLPKHSRRQFTFAIENGSGPESKSKNSSDDGADAALDVQSLDGRYILTIMLSSDGQQWSSEKKLGLLFQNGKLLSSEYIGE